MPFADLTNLSDSPAKLEQLQRAAVVGAVETNRSALDTSFLHVKEKQNYDQIEEVSKLPDDHT